MKRLWAVLAGALILAALVLIIASAGGEEEQTSTTPAPAEAPSGGGTPSLSAFPPEFVECLADQGIDVESVTDVSAVIHSPEGERCFDVLHQGG